MGFSEFFRKSFPVHSQLAQVVSKNIFIHSQYAIPFSPVSWLTVAAAPLATVFDSLLPVLLPLGILVRQCPQSLSSKARLIGSLVSYSNLSSFIEQNLFL